MRSCFAPFSVSIRSASSFDTPPYFTGFCISYSSDACNHGMSEFSDVSTPLLCIIAAFHGVASNASSLYIHQSENVDAAAP
jgi:hypothetical protein